MVADVVAVLGLAVAVTAVGLLLEAMRVLIAGGWDWLVLGRGFGAVALVFAVTFALSLRALAGRVSRG